MKPLLSNINFSFIRVAIMSLVLLYSFCCKRIILFICFAVFNVLMIMKTNQNTKIFICQVNHIYAFAVMKVMKRTGESPILHWEASFFPLASTFFIDKYTKTNRTNILKIENNKIDQSISSKYIYLSKPLNSTNITFVIRNITPEDAGFYAGQTTDRGVVLFVIGKGFFFWHC